MPFMLIFSRPLATLQAYVCTQVHLVTVCDEILRIRTKCIQKVSSCIVHSPIYIYDSMHGIKATEFCSHNAIPYVNMQFYE